jgi:hypothetical protein
MRLMRKLFLGFVLLLVLPVVGSQVNLKDQQPSIAAAGTHESVHWKNSSWPVLARHQLADGNPIGSRIAI